MKLSKQSGFPGFGPQITRRDFVNGIAAGVGAALTTSATSVHAQDQTAVAEPWLESDWYGYGGLGSYQLSHGNRPEVVSTAHGLRDQQFPSRIEDLDSVEEVDLLIVGGGIAGLGAALQFSDKRREGQTCLMLDNHPMIGGEAKENGA